VNEAYYNKLFSVLCKLCSFEVNNIFYKKWVFTQKVRYYCKKSSHQFLKKSILKLEEPILKYFLLIFVQ